MLWVLNCLADIISVWSGGSVVRGFYSAPYLQLFGRFLGLWYIWLQLRKQNRPHLLWALPANMLHISSLFLPLMQCWKENSGELSLNQTSFNGPAVCWPSRVGWNLIPSTTLRCARQSDYTGPNNTLHTSPISALQCNKSTIIKFTFSPRFTGSRRGPIGYNKRYNIA